MPLETPPERAAADPHAARGEFRLQFGEREVAPGGDAVQDQRGLGFDPAGPTVAALRL